jgi:uncharacterized protein (TIGR00661 family)
MKILYGVPGEGMGHATRSKVMIQHLLKNHDVHVVASARAFKFLDQHFPGRVSEIKGFHFAFKDKKVSKSGTLMLNLKNMPSSLSHNLTSLFELEHIFRPDLVISDFESFSYYLAKYHRIPVISIDNMQVIDRCQLDIAIPREQRENYRLAKNIVRAKVPGCKRYFITSFFEAEIQKSNTQLVPSILRDEIVRLQPTYGGPIVVYQTGSIASSIADILNGIPDRNFIVYGAAEESTVKNTTFKKFSEVGFLDDLAHADAVIANGGFSFLSEAVYLKKPTLSIPIAGQFEQYVNAAYIEKLGYGRYFTTLTADHVKTFLYDLNSFKTNLKSYDQRGNDILFSFIDDYLKVV